MNDMHEVLRAERAAGDTVPEMRESGFAAQGERGPEGVGPPQHGAQWRSVAPWLPCEKVRHFSWERRFRTLQTAKAATTIAATMIT